MSKLYVILNTKYHGDGLAIPYEMVTPELLNNIIVIKPSHYSNKGKATKEEDQTIEMKLIKASEIIEENKMYNK
jgi:hypothetical protein